MVDTNMAASTAGNWKRQGEEKFAQSSTAKA
jgi:hypothetical protein